MSNAGVSSGVSSVSRARHMSAGSFFGTIQGKREQCGAIFTDLRHTAPRKLPMHSHELAFFALLLDGLYAERYGRRQSQYGPFTLMFRPAGIPHQDEIGPRGNARDRKSTRLNSSHGYISYAVFCLKKKKKHINLLHTVTSHMSSHHTTT